MIRLAPLSRLLIPICLALLLTTLVNQQSLGMENTTVCDATIPHIEEHLDVACTWNSRILAEELPPITPTFTATPSSKPTLTPTPTSIPPEAKPLFLPLIIDQSP